MQLEIQVKAKEAHEKAVAYFKVAEQYSYQFIMEVKGIRDNQYYKALGFSSFEDYCQACWKVTRKYMDQRIEIAVAIGNERDFGNTYSQLGHSKSLILARMEPEIREQIMNGPQQLPDGVEKTVNEMTVQQLKELQNRLKQTEDRAKEAEARAAAAEAAVLAERNRANHVEKLWQQAKNQPPKVITQTVEVVPESVKKKIEELEFANTNLRHGYQKAKEKLQEYELKNTVDFDAEEARKQREKLQHEADYNTLELRVHIMNFMEKVAITSYLTGAIAAADPVTKKRLRESVEMLEEFVNQIKAALNGRVLGGVINE